MALSGTTKIRSTSETPSDQPPWSGPTRFSKHHLASYLADHGAPEGQLPRLESWPVLCVAGRSALDAVELMNTAWNFRREHLPLSEIRQRLERLTDEQVADLLCSSSSIFVTSPCYQDELLQFLGQSILYPSRIKSLAASWMPAARPSTNSSTCPSVRISGGDMTFK